MHHMMTLTHKLLGQGRYGCVFEPPIPCKNGTTLTGRVGKFIPDPEEANDEYLIMKKVAIIDPIGKYTNLMTEACDLDAETLEQIEDIKRCRSYNENRDNKTFKQLVYAHKGTSLDRCFKEGMSEEVLLHGALYIAEGLHMLSNGGLCHLDLKPDNIIVGEDGSFRMIDFGLSAPLKYVYGPECSYLWTQPYCFHPPEFKLMAKKAWSRNTHSFLVDRLHMIDLDVNTLEDQINAYTEELQSETISMKLLFDRYVNKVDVYSFGVTFLLGLTLNPITLSKTVRDKFTKILRGCLHGNPRLRFSPSELIAELEQLTKGCKRPLHTAKDLNQIANDHGSKVGARISKTLRKVANKT